MTASSEVDRDGSNRSPRSTGSPRSPVSARWPPCLVLGTHAATTGKYTHGTWDWCIRRMEIGCRSLRAVRLPLFGPWVTAATTSFGAVVGALHLASDPAHLPAYVVHRVGRPYLIYHFRDGGPNPATAGSGCATSPPDPDLHRQLHVQWLSAPRAYADGSLAVEVAFYVAPADPGLPAAGGKKPLALAPAAVADLKPLALALVSLV